MNIEAFVSTSKDIHTSGLSKLLKKSKWNGMFHQRFQRSYETQGDRYGSSSYYFLLRNIQCIQEISLERL